MGTDKEILMEAYQKQEKLYGRIQDLVEKQVDVVNGRAGPHRVLKLCKSVEGLLEEISDIEDRIGPLKKRWLKREKELPPEVDATLERIQELIGHIAEMQTEVRQYLRGCARQQADAEGTGDRAGEAAYRGV